MEKNCQKHKPLLFVHSERTQGLERRCILAFVRRPWSVIYDNVWRAAQILEYNIAVNQY